MSSKTRNQKKKNSSNNISEFKVDPDNQRITRNQAKKIEEQLLKENQIKKENRENKRTRKENSKNKKTSKEEKEERKQYIIVDDAEEEDQKAAAEEEIELTSKRPKKNEKRKSQRRRKKESFTESEEDYYDYYSNANIFRYDESSSEEIKETDQNIQKEEEKNKLEPEVKKFLVEILNFYKEKNYSLNFMKSKLKGRIQKLYNLQKFIKEKNGIVNCILNYELENLIKSNSGYLTEEEIKKDYDEFLNEYFENEELKSLKEFEKKEEEKKESEKKEEEKNIDIFSLIPTKKISLKSLLINSIPKYSSFLELETKEAASIISNLISEVIINKSPLTLSNFKTLLKKNNFDLINNQTFEEKGVIFNVENEPKIKEYVENIIDLIPNKRTTNNVLSYSPIEVSGITYPNLMILPNNYPFFFLFNTEERVQFTKYLLNLGPNSIINLIVEEKYGEHLKELDYDNISLDFFYDKNIPFYYSIQKPGDLLIIQSGNYHFCFTEDNSEKKNCIILNWSFLDKTTLNVNKVIDFQKHLEGLNYEIQIPIYSTLIRYFNENINFSLEQIKEFKIKINDMFDKDCDLEKYSNEMSEKHIKFLALTEGNHYFCCLCHREILNFFNISEYNLGTFVTCPDCFFKNFNPYYDSHYLYYKFTRQELNHLFERIDYFIVKTAKKDSIEKINYEKEDKYQQPQKIFKILDFSELTERDIEEQDPNLDQNCKEKLIPRTLLHFFYPSYDLIKPFSLEKKHSFFELNAFQKYISKEQSSEPAFSDFGNEDSSSDNRTSFEELKKKGYSKALINLCNKNFPKEQHRKKEEKYVGNYVNLSFYHSKGNSIFDILEKNAQKKELFLAKNQAEQNNNLKEDGNFLGRKLERDGDNENM